MTNGPVDFRGARTNRKPEDRGQRARGRNLRDQRTEFQKTEVGERNVRGQNYGATATSKQYGVGSKEKNRTEGIRGAPA